MSTVNEINAVVPVPVIVDVTIELMEVLVPFDYISEQDEKEQVLNGIVKYAVIAKLE